MGAAVEVAELFGTLGLRIDKSAWDRADGLFEHTQVSLSSIAKLAVGALAGFSLGSGIKAGIAFNATLEDTRTQIAGMLSLAKHTDLADQLDTADGLMRNLQERAKKLPGSMTDYTKVLGMIAQPITDAGIGIQDLEDITVGTAVAAKAMSVDLEAAARDVNQAIMGQFHSVDQLTGRILGSLGYVGEAGRKRFNDLSKAQRAAVLKQALTQKQLAQLADAQSKNASGRWDTFKATVQQTLGQIAAPLFKRLSGLLAKVNDWLEKNTEAIDKVAGVLGGALQTVFDALLATINFLTNGSDEAHAVLLGIAAAIVAVVVPALLAMAAAWIVALAPILLVIAAVALVAYGIIKLIKHWDKVRAVAGQAWDWIKNKAIGFVDYIKSIPGRIADAFAAMAATIKQAFSDAFDWIAKKANEVIRNIPFVGRIGTALGEGTAFVATKLGLGGDQTPDVNSTSVAPSTSPTYTPSAGNTTIKNVTVGPTTVNVDASNMTPDQARAAMGNVFDERFRDHLRAEDQ